MSGYRAADKELRSLQQDRADLAEQTKRVEEMKSTLLAQVEQWQGQDQKKEDHIRRIRDVEDESNRYQKEVKRLRAENEFLRQENDGFKGRKEAATGVSKSLKIG